MYFEWMNVEIKTICLSLLAILLIYKWMSKKALKFPPGPVGLPLCGYLPFLEQHTAKSLVKLSQKYGPVFSISMGRNVFVVCNSYDVIYEALVKKPVEFAGRVKVDILELYSKETGLIGVDYGSQWKFYRKFAVTALKRFGVGKRSIEEKICEETRYLCELFESKNGEPFNITDDLANAVSNIICCIITGRRFNYDDNRFKKLMFLLKRRFSGEVDANLNLLMRIVPELRFLPVFRGVFHRTMEQIRFHEDLMNDLIEEHKKTFDEVEIRDIIDAYLLEINKNEDQFSKKKINVFLRDFFNAGTETNTTVLRWCFLYLARNPDFQERMYREIHILLGDSGLPEMKNHLETPLTCSFIQEVQRHRSIVPTVIHKTTEDTELMGYKIPKGVGIFVNLWAVHHDPETFKDPDVFKPERFLNHNGEFVKHSQVIPFSIGHRYCVAAKLAEMEIYMFLTGVVQKFKLAPENDVNSLPSFEEGISGLVHSALPYKIRFIKR